MMNGNRQVTLFHAPNTRSLGALALLEELGADYRLKVLDLKAGEQRKPEFLAINPMGKVPALLHADAVVTELVAIYIYLADLYAESGLAPGIGNPLRGPYLRWLVFYGSCFEPALVDKRLKREPPPRSTSPYGDYETMLKTLSDQLAKGPYILGEKFTAADVLWSIALSWSVAFKLVPKSPPIRAYIDRINLRPAVERARAKDAEPAAAQR
ncbi:glutathione S-transferase [Methylocaldum marinum]|uniref:Glutathione S-transferase n=1 Tax=Methylocaldum marinum TaxID=1432792 RepID=A0A250KXP3_9GAMM|nr:glutathione S-transferase N-terminal domain-containing protein [Methylocaldum marinum]BBA36296.1 glutathione S-transferase [Methylocaldum marinum]